MKSINEFRKGEGSNPQIVKGIMIAPLHEDTTYLGGRVVVRVRDEVDNSSNRTVFLSVNFEPSKNPLLPYNLPAANEGLKSLVTNLEFRRLFRPGITFLAEVWPVFDDDILWLNVSDLLLIEPDIRVGTRVLSANLFCQRQIYLRAVRAVAIQSASERNIRTIGTLVGDLTHLLLAEILKYPTILSDNLKYKTAWEILEKKLSIDKILAISLLHNHISAGDLCRQAISHIQRLVKNKDTITSLQCTDWESEVPAASFGIDGICDLKAPGYILELKTTKLKAKTHFDQLQVYFIGEMITHGVNKVLDNYKGAILYSSSNIDDNERYYPVLPQREFLNKFLITRHQIILESIGLGIPAPSTSSCFKCDLSDPQEDKPATCQFYCQIERHWHCINNENGNFNACPLFNNCDQRFIYHRVEHIDAANELRQEIEIHRIAEIIWSRLFIPKENLIHLINAHAVIPIKTILNRLYRNQIILELEESVSSEILSVGREIIIRDESRQFFLQGHISFSSNVTLAVYLDPAGSEIPEKPLKLHLELTHTNPIPSWTAHRMVDIFQRSGHFEHIIKASTKRLGDSGKNSSIKSISNTDTKDVMVIYNDNSNIKEVLSNILSSIGKERLIILEENGESKMFPCSISKFTIRGDTVHRYMEKTGILEMRIDSLAEAINNSQVLVMPLKYGLDGTLRSMIECLMDNPPIICVWNGHLLSVISKEYLSQLSSKLFVFCKVKQSPASQPTSWGPGISLFHRLHEYGSYSSETIIHLHNYENNWAPGPFKIPLKIDKSFQLSLSADDIVESLKLDCSSTPIQHAVLGSLNDNILSTFEKSVSAIAHRLGSELISIIYEKENNRYILDFEPIL